MPAHVSIWTNEDTSEAGPTVDEERATFTVSTDINDPSGDVRPGGADLHIVTDGAHGLWTVMLKLSPAAKDKLIADLTEGA